MIQASERRSSQNFHSWEATFYLLNTLDPPCSGPYKGQVVINSFSNKTKSFSHTNQIISMRLCTSATNKTSTTPHSRICTQNKKCPHLMLKRNIKHDKNNTHFHLYLQMRPLHQLGVPDHLRDLLHLPALHLHRGAHPLQLRDQSGVKGTQSGEITCDVLRRASASDHATFPRDQVYSVSASFQCSSLLSKR